VLALVANVVVNKASVFDVFSKCFELDSQRMGSNTAIKELWCHTKESKNQIGLPAIY
jgi:hypothetical protein